jgi:hypothetical protein
VAIEFSPELFVVIFNFEYLIIVRDKGNLIKNETEEEKNIIRLK